MKQADQEKVADPSAALRQKFEKDFPFLRVDSSDRPELAWKAAQWGYRAAQPSSADLEKLAREIADLLTTLEELAEGRGRFSLDHHQHAKNTIEDMKELAKVAIGKAKSLQLLTSTLGTK